VSFSPTRRLVAVLLALVAGFVLSPVAMLRAQEGNPLLKLDPTTQYAVQALLDSARSLGLPTAPLESKALQGVALHVDGRRIVAQVRVVFNALRNARTALGAVASTDELGAAAVALEAGIPLDAIGRMARSRGEKPLTIPFVVLADLVTRGVPRDTASQTILQLWQRGAAEDDILGLWKGVERDIISGTAPADALVNRAREIPVRAPPRAATPPSRPPENPESPTF
jgi:hypothetical protein